jgi:hypothetical protein
MTNKVQNYLTRLRAYYPPKDVSARAKIVHFLLTEGRMRQTELAREVVCSPSHIHQLNFLAENCSDDELRAIDELGLSVWKAYQLVLKTHL